jgi:hypothetical protein
MSHPAFKQGPCFRFFRNRFSTTGLSLQEEGVGGAETQYERSAKREAFEDSRTGCRD